MTTFYLIRHGSNDYINSTLIGRQAGIGLNDAGRAEAGRLADALSRDGIQQVFSSPLDRCQQTAAPLAKALSLELQIADALVEVNFGEWTGKTFSELEGDARWKQWNAFRSGARAPGGETILEVQARVVGFVERLTRDFRGQRMAIVSHGDPLRTVLLYYLGMSLDHIRRIELGPASVSVLQIAGFDAQVQSLNVQFSDRPDRRG